MHRSPRRLLIRARLLVPTFLLLFALIGLGPSLAVASPASPATSVRYKVIDLGTLGGANSFGYCLNAKGHVVGDSEIAIPAAATPAASPAAGAAKTAPLRHAFLWRDGTMTDLGTLGGPTSRTTAINDADHVAGAADTADGKPHAFLWKDGGMQDLGTLGGDQSWAIGINNHDQISGLSTTAPGQELGDPGTHGFLWENGKMTDLGTFGGEFARANGLNDAGQVVGFSETGPGTASSPAPTHGYLWENGVMTDVNDLLVPGSSWNVTVVRILNDAGQIVGEAVAKGVTHAVLLTPAG